MKTICPCGATCEVWLKSSVVLKRKLGLIVCNSCIMCMLWKFFKFNLVVNFLYFLSNWVNLLGIFTSCEKLRAFKRNPCFWNRYLMPWRWIRVLKNISVANMAGNETKRDLQTMIYCISSHFWSITRVWIKSLGSF